MTPVEAAIHTVHRVVGSFSPSAVPALSRAYYRRELIAWFFLPVMLGAVEGGVTGIIAKNAFAEAVPEFWLNICVALLTGAPAFANITSFLWTSLSHGREKIRFLVGLQITASILVALIALAPASWVGLMMLTAGAVGTRMCWAGVATLRTAVWAANYPRTMRARMAGKLATVQVIVLATTGLSIGLALRADERAFHWLFPIAAGFGFVGSLLYSRMRMRGTAALIKSERSDRTGRALGVSPARIARILHEDRMFRRYMGAMFIFGIGNLAMLAPLVIIVSDVFEYGYLRGIIVTSTLPIIMMPLAIPVWSRLLDRMHIIRFRSFHCWSFVLANLVALIAALTVNHTLLWTSSVLRGLAMGGGILGWNLGHHDFAPTARASQYMGVHVTLTGIRGFIGPPAAVGLYGLFNAWHAGAGPWVFGVCLAINLIGAGLFLALRRMLDEQQKTELDRRELAAKEAT